MPDTFRAISDGELERFASFAGPPADDEIIGVVPRSRDEIDAHQADEHWMVVDDGGVIRARCSLWWSAAPQYPGERIGAIGHYAAREAGAAAELLDTACRRLEQESCTLAVGPMDGNTWRRYRFVTDRGSEPTFLMDLVHPPDWPRQFESSGFETVERYISTLNPNTSRRDAAETRWRGRVVDAGITLRPVDMTRFKAELEHIFEISLASFADNPFYTPLDRNSFLRMYLPFADRVRPDLVLVAERNREAVGFAFCIPDLLQAQRGEKIDTVILKTIAVHPDVAGHGLGGLLAAESQRISWELGFRRYIYAFMHEDNPSAGISARYAQPIRHYSLFSKRLDRQ